MILYKSITLNEAIIRSALQHLAQIRPYNKR